ncbi:MAG: hypothetical protein Q4G04_05055 [bacterium]|nr:hypothetical protein [bacterium]
MDKVYLQYNSPHHEVACNIGPVWIMLLLGSIYPLKNKDYKFFGIIILSKIASLILIMLFIKNIYIAITTFLFVYLLINLLFALNYNLIIIEYYINQGYKPLTRESAEKLLKKGLYFQV